MFCTLPEVNPEYSKILQSAAGKFPETRRFLEKLQKKKTTDLDQVTNELHDKAFEEIDCLQCANCCKTTGPLLLNKDVERLAKDKKISPSAFTEKYLRIDEDRDYVFKSMPCPFLMSDNCCSVYSSRPNACREYPHTSQRNIVAKLKITAENTKICPAVVMVVEGLKKKYG